MEKTGKREQFQTELNKILSAESEAARNLVQRAIDSEVHVDIFIRGGMTDAAEEILEILGFSEGQNEYIHILSSVDDTQSDHLQIKLDNLVSQ